LSQASSGAFGQSGVFSTSGDGMIGWQALIGKRRRMERKRQERLLSKMQKARVVEQQEEVKAEPSWGKRFRKVITLRAKSRSSD
jgi:hypothetical protein